MSIFRSAGLMIPRQESLSNWAVIACDQFTSQPEYWEAVRTQVGTQPSSYHLIFPEAELGASDPQARIEAIHHAMEETRRSGWLQTFEDAFIYVERTLLNGSVRRGIVGVIDLEAYDFMPGSTSAVRATEKTVLERIPPRVRIRKNASLELSHVLLLADDDENRLIEPLTDKKGAMTCLYDFDLMADGGHIAGYLLDAETRQSLRDALTAYEAGLRKGYAALEIPPVLYAVGDGNHSLAAAKQCWTDLKAAHPELAGSSHPARYAMVELENIHDPVQQFEPIHRVVSQTDPKALLAFLGQYHRGSEAAGYPIRCCSADGEEMLYLDRDLSALAIGALQPLLDRWLSDHPGTLDYIHGDETALALGRRPGCIALMLPAVDKADFFQAIALDGVMPRKTFSMGHAREKRYYLEARQIVKS